MLGQISVDTNQHLHLKSEVDPIWLALESLVFLSLHELILLGRVVRLLEVVEPLSGHSRKVLALDPLGMLVG